MGSRSTGRRVRRAATLMLTTGASIVALAACGSSDGGTSTGASGPVGGGITRPVDLAAYQPSDKAGTKPDLPKRLALAMDNDREFAQSIKHGLEVATKERGIEFVSANANGDSAKNVQQLQQFLAQGVGALWVNPIDPAAQGPVMKQALDRGIAVLGVLMPPSTLQMNANQYTVGKALGDDAARYIEDQLGGKANVVILNQDSIEPVRPRFRAIRDALKTVPGAKIVADIEPSQTQKDSAFSTMNTILQKNPQVDVVLGADSVVLGAYAALRAAHKDTPQQYLGGVDGEPEALADIKAGGAYKASVALAPAVLAYAAGLSAADWLDGKTIPQAIDVHPVLLNSPAAVDAFAADEDDPSGTFADQAKRDRYLTLRGGISYDTRGKYLNYVWTP
ncbi:MAG TPA: sugar ABC transporter substrate-binding protein [Conexibacter sp.]|nr:sugar ABC transporter substrate-binding protein [Conexibacter sp.]